VLVLSIIGVFMSLVIGPLGGDTTAWFPLGCSFLPPKNRREASCTHTLSSGNMRQAYRLRGARVTFPQRLHVGMPLRGGKKAMALAAPILARGPQFTKDICGRKRSHSVRARDAGGVSCARGDGRCAGAQCRPTQPTGRGRTGTEANSRAWRRTGAARQAPGFKEVTRQSQLPPPIS
jgi:hypothetical protein